MTPYGNSCSSRASKYLFWLAAAVFVSWVFFEPMTRLPVVLRNVPFAADYLRGMIPPDLTILPSLWEPVKETIQIAFAGTLLATAASLPLSFLAAANTSPSRVLCVSMRWLFNFLRAMPVLVWAMFFVSLCGLGTLAGIFGIMFHTTGTLGKLFLECIEATGPKIGDRLEAMRIDGATEPQLVRWGIIPEVLPLFMSYTLYRLETSVRASTILGMVGAGGLGEVLYVAMRMFRRQESLAIMLVILALVTAVDVLSSQLRKYILDRGGYG